MMNIMTGQAVFPERSHTALRKLRTKRGLSQDELGFRAGVAQARLSRAERGYLWLTESERLNVARVLGVEVGDLDEPSGKHPSHQGHGTTPEG